LEIIDNGSGIAPDDFDKLCKNWLFVKY
jgi:DNA mismatch repair ATPase MutL